MYEVSDPNYIGRNKVNFTEVFLEDERFYRGNSRFENN